MHSDLKHGSHAGWVAPRSPRWDLDSPASVGKFFRDHVAVESSIHPMLCRHPIALHPVRRTSEYKKLWNALDVRDRGRDEALRFWQSGGIEGAGGAP